MSQEQVATLPAEWSAPEILEPLHGIWTHLFELRPEPITACEAMKFAFAVDWLHLTEHRMRLIPRAPWSGIGTKCDDGCPNRRIWLVPDGVHAILPDGHVRYAYFPGKA